MAKVAPCIESSSFDEVLIHLLLHGHSFFLNVYEQMDHSLYHAVLSERCYLNDGRLKGNHGGHVSMMADVSVHEIRKDNFKGRLIHLHSLVLNSSASQDKIAT